MISIKNSPLILSLEFFNNIKISLISLSIFNGLIYLLGFIFFERFIFKLIIFAPVALGKKTYFIIPFLFIVGLV